MNERVDTSLLNPELYAEKTQSNRQERLLYGKTTFDIRRSAF